MKKGTTRLSAQDPPQTAKAVPPSNKTTGQLAKLYSLNLMYDPGFELFVGNALQTYRVQETAADRLELGDHGSFKNWDDKTGQRHYTLPVFTPGVDIAPGIPGQKQLWPNGDLVSYWDVAQWVSTGYQAGWNPTGKLSSQAWHVTRLEPYLGDYCAIWHRWTTGPGGNPTMLMVQAPGFAGGFSARVDAGDVLSWSVRAKVWESPDDQVFSLPDYALAITPTISPILYFYDESGTLIVGSGNYYQALDNWEYLEFRHDAVAPAGSHLVTALVAFTAQTPDVVFDSGNNDPAVQVDSGVLSIQ